MIGRRFRFPSVASLLLVAVICFVANPVFAKITAEQRKEIGALRKELLKTINPLLRKKSFDEAEQGIQKIADKLKEMNIEDGETDRTYRLLIQTLNQMHARLPVSFEDKVAPILKDNCVRCHSGNNPSGKLLLDTFNGLRRGGQNGLLLVPGNPNRSLLVARLVTTQRSARMPKKRQRFAPAANSDNFHMDSSGSSLRWLECQCAHWHFESHGTQGRSERETESRHGGWIRNRVFQPRHRPMDG